MEVRPSGFVPLCARVGGVPLGICSFMYFIVGGCILCAGDVCKWVCIEMCEGWRGALRDFPYP